MPGAAHAATFWGFIVLLLTIIEAYGALFQRTFAIPGIGHWAVIGFLEDLFAVGVLAGIITFTVIRLRNDPHREGRRSRFFGSHTRAAWVVLGMIAAVIVTLLIYRGAQQNTGVFPYPNGWAFASWVVAKILHPLGYGVNSVLEVVFILAQLGVVLAFLVIVTYSKHLHIGLAPLNILFSRRPDGLGPLEPMRSNGKVLDFEEADPDTDTFGIGKVEDLSWKGMLDLATCTECGRCQSQCPAWVTGKPLSPKQLILDLRDHAFAKAPYLLADEEGRVGLSAAALAEAERPLVGGVAEMGVIDPEVIWACTNCGACVNECPVDIEHIDHINGMRRHQVLVESAFPTEATTMLNNLERRGNPWGMAEDRRADWIGELDFEVPVLDGKIPDDVEYLYWVGCAGALEDRAKKATKAIAELLNVAGVKFAVLGPMEACTGDPARRLGNEFVFSMLAQQNIETLERRGRGQGQREEGHRLLPALLQHHLPGVPPAGRGLRGRTPHPAAGPPGRRGQAHPGHPGGREDHLPRPVLPRPAQPGVHAAPSHHRRRPRHPGRGDAPLQGQGVLLRGRRRPHVAGGAHRQADQRRAHRRGPGPRPGHRLAPPARTAWSCSATPSTPRRRPARPRSRWRSSTSRSSWSAPSSCARARISQPATREPRRRSSVTARAVGRRGLRPRRFGAEPVAAQRRVGRRQVEPRVAVLADQTAAPFGDLPVPPASLGVVGRVEPSPGPPGQADQPGDANAAGPSGPLG